mgnify:CR=1 FL=1
MIAAPVQAQTEFRIWTDRPVYNIGEPVTVHIQPAPALGVQYWLEVWGPGGFETRSDLSPGQDSATFWDVTGLAGQHLVELWGQVVAPDTQPQVFAGCQFEVAGGPRCQSDYDCPLGYMCSNGECVDRCSLMFCPEGTTCINGECVPIQQCSEGAVRNEVKCPDGVNWKQREVCRNNAWVEETQPCPIPRQAPTAYIDSISPNPAEQGQTVSFSGHGSDPDGHIVEYNWRSSIDRQLSGSQSFSTSSLSVGTHTIYFKVKDNDGLWSEEATATLEMRPTPVRKIAITQFEITGSGQPTPAAIGVSFAVENLGIATMSVVVKIEKWTGTDSRTILSEELTLLPNQPKKFGQTWQETVTGDHLVVVSILTSDGTLVTSEDGKYVVGPATPGGEKLVMFVSDPFDATTGKLQIQNPDGSVKEIRTKKVQVEITYPGMEIKPRISPSLKLYSYVPVPTHVCLARTVVPLTIEDMVETGFVELTEEVVTQIAGKYVPISYVVMAVEVVQCFIDPGEDMVQIDRDWKFDQPQKLYFALDRDAKLEAVFEWFPPDTTMSVKEIGEWRGPVSGSTNQITIAIGSKDSLLVSGGSSIGLQVVDPLGRRAGATAENGEWSAVREIPGAYYSGLNSHPQYVVILEPEPGPYKVLVSAKESGALQLAVTKIVGGSPVSSKTYSGAISQGETQEYSSELTSDGNVILKPTTTASNAYWPLVAGVAIAVVLGGVLFIQRRRHAQGRRRKLQGPRIKEIRSTVGKPRVKSIQETGRKPRVLKVEEE